MSISNNELSEKNIKQLILPYKINEKEYYNNFSNCILINGNKSLHQSQIHISEVQTSILNKSSELIETFKKILFESEENLTNILLEKQKDYNFEFEKILNENKILLKNQEFLENYGFITGSTIGTIVGYRFSNFIISTIAIIIGSVGSFFYWLILSFKILIETIPFTSKLIPIFNTRCYTTNPFGNIWPNVIEMSILVTNYSYKYKNKWTGEAFNIINQPFCFNSSSIYERVGECVQGISKQTTEICETFPEFNINYLLGNDIKFTCSILGLFLGGILVFYTIKIVKFQTRLHEFKIGKSGNIILLPFEILKDIFKTGKWITGIGLLIDIILPSQERVELIKMVTNNEIKLEGKMVKKAEYVKNQEEQFIKTHAYIECKVRVDRAQQNYDKSVINAMNLTTKTLDAAEKLAAMQIKTIETMTIQTINKI